MTEHAYYKYLLKNIGYGVRELNNKLKPISKSDMHLKNLLHELNFIVSRLESYIQELDKNLKN